MCALRVRAHAHAHDRSAMRTRVDSKDTNYCGASERKTSHTLALMMPRLVRAAAKVQLSREERR